VDELILRAIVIQFDGQVVEVFGATSGDGARYHVAFLREPDIGKSDYKGRTRVVIGNSSFSVGADEVPRLMRLIAKISEAIRAAKRQRDGPR